MIEDKYIEVSYAEFEIDIKIPVYLVTATADVWCDLTGIFFVYSVDEQQFITTLYIKDNSNKYKEIAICLWNLLQSERFILLKPLCDYTDYYHYHNGRLILLSKHSKTIKTDVPSLAHKEKVLSEDIFLERGLIDCSDQSLNLVYCSWRGVEDDEYYVVTEQTHKLYHVPYFDCYDDKLDPVIDRIDLLTIVESKNGFLALNPLKHSLYQYIDSKLDELGYHEHSRINIR